MVQLCRPIKKVHRFEYEDFFGFGGHCEGFSLDRIIITFTESFDKELDIEYLLMTGMLVGSGDGDGDGEGEGEKCCDIDEQYIKNTLKLLVVGGYVKYWTAFNEFKKWFKERGFDYEIITDTAGSMTSFMFEDYEMEKKVENEVEYDMVMVKES